MGFEPLRICSQPGTILAPPSSRLRLQCITLRVGRPRDSPVRSGGEGSRREEGWPTTSRPTGVTVIGQQRWRRKLAADVVAGLAAAPSGSETRPRTRIAIGRMFRIDRGAAQPYPLDQGSDSIFTVTAPCEPRANIARGACGQRVSSGAGRQQRPRRCRGAVQRQGLRVRRLIHV